MSNGERHREPARRTKSSTERREGADGGPVAAEPSVPATHATCDGLPIWVLPTARGGWWAVGDVGPADLATAMHNATPVILAPQVIPGQEQGLVACARDLAVKSLSDRLRVSLLAFVGLVLVALVCIVAALVSLWFSAWPYGYGVALLLLGIAFLVYAGIRYALGAARMQYARVDAEQAFSRARCVASPLAERLARALHLRTTLPPAERGKSPDDELLDAQAYRKLIGSGAIATSELCVLGRSIAAALKLDAKDGDERKLADIARGAGLDKETALFYRDLAMAAAEIGLADDLAQITNGL